MPAAVELEELPHAASVRAVAEMPIALRKFRTRDTFHSGFSFLSFLFLRSSARFCVCRAFVVFSLTQSEAFPATKKPKSIFHFPCSCSESCSIFSSFRPLFLFIFRGFFCPKKRKQGRSPSPACFKVRGVQPVIQCALFCLKDLLYSGLFQFFQNSGSASSESR